MPPQKGDSAKQWGSDMSVAVADPEVSAHTKAGGDIKGAPAPASVGQCDHNLLTKKQDGTWLGVTYHSVTAMIGAGVLGLPYAFSYLGWVAGTIIFSLAFVASWYTYRVLCLMHETDDLSAPNGKRRFTRYQELTTYLLGRRTGFWALVPFQLCVLVGTSIVYVITGTNNLVSFIELVGSPFAHYHLVMMCLFVACQLVLAQTPSFSHLAIVSCVGAFMSFCYCGISLVLSAIQAATYGVANVDYSLPPQSVQQASNPTTAFVFGIFNACTTFLFAYGGHNIALEIQATLPCPPTSVKPMLKGVHVTFALTFVCYFGVAICGYAAFGSAVSGNILDSLTIGPIGLRAAAHLMVVVHVLAAYQVYSYPVYDMMESSIARRLGRPPPIALSVAVRCAYVLATFVVGLLLPFFGDIMGLVGAVGITPTTFVLPCVLWLLWAKPAKWGRRFLTNSTCAIACTVVGVLGLIGSIYSITVSYQTWNFTSNF